MKVLILYTYNKGLLSEFFQELSEKLVKDGFEVINFYLKHHKASFQQKGVSYYGEKRLGLVSNYKSIYKIIKQTKPDVVISNFSYINPAILFGKLLGVKRNIAWFHSAFGHTKPNILKVWNKMMYLNLADIVLTNSESLENEMHTVYRVSKEKTRRIPFWTNIVHYRTNSNSLNIVRDETVINIGCPGRLVADKNHATVIEALYNLKEKHQKTIRLYIAGNGIYNNELKRLVAKLNLEQDVVFLGLLNVAEMTAFYEAMDVVVLPSLHEAFGLVFIEAIALGTPVIVSKAFGALSFIDNKKFSLNNFTFNPEDKDDLIEKLIPYCNKAGLSKAYFKGLYKCTFDKAVIYSQVKAVILQQN